MTNDPQDLPELDEYLPTDLSQLSVRLAKVAPTKTPTGWHFSAAEVSALNAIEDVDGNLIGVEVERQSWGTYLVTDPALAVKVATALGVGLPGS